MVGTGMAHKITLIYGDGIGPEVICSAVAIVKAAQVRVTWEEHFLGSEAIKRGLEIVPQATIDSIKNTKVALKGPTATPIGHGHGSANVMLRKALDLFACIRPVKSISGIQTRFAGID